MNFGYVQFIHEETATTSFAHLSLSFTGRLIKQYLDRRSVGMLWRVGIRHVVRLEV